MGKKKGNSEQKEGGDLDDREQPLQAVLLADDWNGFTVSSATKWAFQPLTADRPRVLFPLLDRPLIDYSISYLSSQNVQELFVVCSTQDVEEYVKESASLQKFAMNIVVIRDSTVTNAGDALRELDKRSVIESDPFVLMHGDTVANYDISRVIQAHKERRKEDSSAILTMLFSASKNQRTLVDDLIVGIDPHQSNRILLYENDQESNSVVAPCSFFASHCTSLVVHTDLLDVGIDLCSPDVLARFSDEFDYRDIRSQFVANSVAEEEEGLQNKLFAHIITGGYAACCTDMRTFHQVSRDILRRCAHPVVPNIPMQGHNNYMYMVANDIRMGRSSHVVGPGLLGASVVIGDRCVVTGSVVCNHSHIGDGCTIKDSHLWEGVQVEANARIEQAVLGAGVVVRSGATISKGCVVGAGCIVGANIVVPEYTRLTCSTALSDEDEEDDWDESSDEDSTAQAADPTEAVVSDVAVVGPDGIGRTWKPSDEDIDEDFFLQPDLILQSQCIGCDGKEIASRKLIVQAENHDELSDDDDEPEDFADADDTLMFGAASPLIVGRQEGVDVIKELKAICLEYEDSSPIENLAIELNSQNASYSDCTLAATLAIVEKMTITAESTDGRLVSDFKGLLTIWKPLLQKMSIGLEEEKAIVFALQQCAVSDHLAPILSTGMSFRFLLQTLHDNEIVSEESILSWSSDPKAEPRLVSMTPVQEFLEWLRDDDDEDESEDDDDSNESD